MSSGNPDEQIWQRLSVDALAILASSELITKELNEAVLEEKTIEYNSDVRYTIGGKFLSDHLEAFNSQNNARNLISHNHQHVIEPDYNTPFNSYEDALDRLLPYHVYQQPVEDTHVSRPSTSLGDDTVLDFYARRQKIYDRFRKAREFDVIHKSHSNFLLRQVNSHIKDDNVRLAQQIRDLKGVPGVSTTNRSATSTPAPSTPANNAQIPLTLPYTRLGQLMSLGITPVPIANVQNGDSPACVLHSVIENRGMVHLVVNFGSLNPRQLNTLAQLLRTWVSENDRNAGNIGENNSRNTNNDTTSND
ncbi:hypothetical protein E3P92_02590 [Wallemia ichthyophaga]|uniref:GLTSCR protein conserved domain-containing protein n=2 Tax=Wallemia ichthyophaga TaxID=245174 RepID=A0A4V4LVL5_WALIC|nr:uncharacterized protein J056_001798 [Wallemia ichthyophaga EXF-994]TIA71407.1 hypothetical protein E3P91_02608 [Wallemia ichthyophaga]EOQ99475.1 hypothetical protein J056_001798 [Wallemia ichthyophaga EXF-994]TIA80971.1 hypothetical protein E3P98_02411 [Wallemia ichthyophaga]TIA89977.1 hypothetical protein E3P97_02797 [Wallemia ichthyophaga]TIA98683.1 hypothetical protein E3P95_02377 [Wallemia ichthyophaga]